MGLNESRGNMYEFVTHTWNAIKGQCYHDCSYCYMKRWGSLQPIRLDQKELRVNLGSGNFIFVGSSCDVFAEDVPSIWIEQVLDYTSQFNNRYLFQSKNPARMGTYLKERSDVVVCTTIETNRWYPSVMNRSPRPQARALAMSRIDLPRYVTIEPIMDFDLNKLIQLIMLCKPQQVNIGADSGGNQLPEPKAPKILALIKLLNTFTVIDQKRNLKRLLR